MSNQKGALTMPDLWQDAMDHAVTVARKSGEVR